MSDDLKPVILTGKKRSLTPDTIYEIAHGRPVDLSAEAKQRVRDNRACLEKQLQNHPDLPIYGTNRLHGDLKNVAIDNATLNEYQVKYIQVHNCGSGPPLPREYVRAMMVIRLNSFAKGLSGMRLETCQCMIEMLNRQVTPVVLEEGSVGASGDLVSLAMMAATMIGLEQAKAYFGDEPNPIPATEAMSRAGIQPIELAAKEAMGLTNGSNFIAGIATIELLKSEHLLKVASVTSALTLEAIRGERKAFGEIINEKSDRSPFQIAVANEVRSLTDGSRRTSTPGQTSLFAWSDAQRNKKIRKLRARLETGSHQQALDTVLTTVERELARSTKHDAPGVLRAIIEQMEKLQTPLNPKDPESRTRLPEIAVMETESFTKVLLEMFLATKPEPRVQDRYSIRAVPQVNGAARKAIDHLRDTLIDEINSATDNPLFDFDDSPAEINLDFEFASGANFHGQPLAMVIDYVKIALTSVGLISDKRSFSLLAKELNYGLPPALAFDTSEADAGLMITQYAGAARAADNRVLSTPASVMSISTAANQEDFVSMGSIGVVNLIKINENLAKILGIELLCAIRALQLTYDWLPKSHQDLGIGTAKVFELLSGPDYFPIGDEQQFLKDHFLENDMSRAREIVESSLLTDLFEDLWI